MATLLVEIMFGAFAFGVVGAGLILMNYILNKKKVENIVSNVKTAIIPEFEGMTKRILVDSMDLVVEKSVEMTKKMMASQYDED